MTPILSPEQQAMRTIREHFRNHDGQQGCVQCDIWDAYNRGDEEALTAIEARIGDDGLRAAVRILRAGWGEGSWTDRVSE